MIFERIPDTNIIRYDIYNIKENRMELIHSIENIATDPIKVTLYLSLDNLVNHVNGLYFKYYVKVKPLLFYPIEIFKKEFLFKDYSIDNNIVTINYGLSKYDVLTMTCYIDGYKYDLPENVNKENIIVRPILDGNSRYVGRHNLL